MGRINRNTGSLPLVWASPEAVMLAYGRGRFDAHGIKSTVLIVAAWQDPPCSPCDRLSRGAQV
jgi:hypothetical protein